MGNRFSSAKNSIAECDRCGFRYKLKELKKLTIKTKVGLGTDRWGKRK